MPYSVITDVAQEFKSLTFSSASTPTDAVVKGFIIQSDAEIDAKIGLRYAVPINTKTSPIAAITLKRLSVWLTASRVREIQQVKTGDLATAQLGRSGDIGKMARDQLEQIACGKYLLTDAPLANTTEGLKSFGVGAGETLFFDKDLPQW